MPIKINCIEILTIISPRCSFSQFDRLTRDLDILPFASQKFSATHLDPAGHSVCTAAAFWAKRRSYNWKSILVWQDFGYRLKLVMKKLKLSYLVWKVLEDCFHSFHHLHTHHRRTSYFERAQVFFWALVFSVVADLHEQVCCCLLDYCCHSNAAEMLN